MRGIKTGIVPSLAICLLTASTVVGAAESDTAAPESTNARPIELPAEIPEGIESGTLKTPLGPAGWVHLGGDRASLAPKIRDVVSTPGGFILEFLDNGATLWRSPDLLTWTAQPLDIPARQLSYTSDGTYWANSGNAWWRSQDTASWEQVDFGSLAPPRRDGYAYALHLNGPPIVYDGVTVVPYWWGADYGVVTRDHPLAEQAHGLHEIEPGVYKLGHPRLAAPTVRFEQTEGGLRMVDHEKGTELKVLDGISMEFIERLVSDPRIPGIHGLVIVDGDGSVDVELPDDMRRGYFWYKTDRRGFAASGRRGGLVTVYRSQDGRDWHQTDIIGDDVGEPTDVAHFDPRTDVTTAVSTDGTQWTTTDGQQWKELPRPPQTNAHRFAAGWIRTTNRFPMWYYPDRGKVVRIDHSAMALPPKRECAGSPYPISSNTLYMSCKRNGVRDTWIITFDDVPA